jgi:hypothetical protein
LQRVATLPMPFILASALPATRRPPCKDAPPLKTAGSAHSASVGRMCAGPLALHTASTVRGCGTSATSPSDSGPFGDATASSQGGSLSRPRGGHPRTRSRGRGVKKDGRGRERGRVLGPDLLSSTRHDDSSRPQRQPPPHNSTLSGSALVCARPFSFIARPALVGIGLKARTQPAGGGGSSGGAADAHAYHAPVKRVMHSAATLAAHHQGAGDMRHASRTCQARDAQRCRARCAPPRRWGHAPRIACL